MPEPPTLMSPLLAAAMAHPIRLKVFSLLLDQEVAITAKEIADEVKETRSSVNYHLKVLLELNCVEIVNVDSSGGGRVVRHSYMASDRAYFDAEGWDRLDRPTKLKIAIILLRVISEDINEAVGHGTFLDPDDGHLSRSPMRVDSEGWAEVRDFLTESCLDGLRAIQERVDERCEGGDRTTFPVRVHMVQHRSHRDQKHRR